MKTTTTTLAEVKRRHANAVQQKEPYVWFMAEGRECCIGTMKCDSAWWDRAEYADLLRVAVK